MAPPAVEIDFLGLSSSQKHHPGLPPDPVPAVGWRAAEMMQLTIFYDGSVSVFHVPPNTAAAIIGLAERESAAAAAAAAEEEERGSRVSSLLPLARQRSLQRFLQNRQERMMAAARSGDPSGFSSTDSGGGGEQMLGER